MNESVVFWLNSLTAEAACEEFRKCCGASWWCNRMVRERPYANDAELKEAADLAFVAMPREAWMEAFGSHPKIGDLNSLRMRLAGNKQWSSGEQAGVSECDEQTLAGLAEGNKAYEKRFGFAFIICATGLAAVELLAQLKLRLQSDEHEEFGVACEEQRKITHLRLDKLAAQANSNRKEFE